MTDMTDDDDDDKYLKVRGYCRHKDLDSPRQRYIQIYLYELPNQKSHSNKIQFIIYSKDC